MAKQFEFADFVDEFRVSFKVYDREVHGDYNVQGKWVEGQEVPRPMDGIILPLSNDDLRREGNGTYTTKDRKIYVTEPLKIGQRIEHKEQKYTIDAEKDYSDYADVYIYIAKGVGNQ